METRILQVNKIQERIYGEVKAEIQRCSVTRFGRTPGIAFLGFEGVPLGKYTLPLHLKAAMDTGFRVFHHIFPADVGFPEVAALIDRYNDDPEVNAIVILQPVPVHLNPILVENQIRPQKEVEGFHPQNMLGTMIPEINSHSCPMCLPQALMEIFREENLTIKKGSPWLFILDDEFLSNPLTRMIVRAAASRVVPKESPVTFINKDSEMVAAYCKNADYLVVVSKTPGFVDPDWLKQGVTIIDIYSNLVKEVPSKNDPSKLVPVIRGGVFVERVQGIASGILSIPGGLMTVVLAILLRNAVSAFKAQEKIN
jgi:methylenetetrahydrofolate dehydrogenase (NADP+)/methenyltetrahydrofolate cyclohydrolase